jgi:hypothetical protein
MPIKVEVWDYLASGKHDLLGETNFTIQQAVANQGASLPLISRGKGNKVGSLLLKKVLLSVPFTRSSM